jgi:Zn-dependent peptidase ImmA (M78 family)
MATTAMTIQSDLLDEVFGEDSVGDTPEARARTSNRKFVRSQHQLSEYRPGATGKILSAAEALDLFQWDVLAELADRPATPILVNGDEPYRTIENQLIQLGVSFADAARKQRWSADSIRRFEERKQVPFRDLERLARGIDVEDEDRLGLTTENQGDPQFGVRLRTLKGRDPRIFTTNTVLDLAETAWTIRKQLELASRVHAPELRAREELGFAPSDYYGGPGTPAWQVGYRLAEEARRLLNIGPDAPIESLKELVEVRLGIPVIQLELHTDLAGATVASRSQRGIAVNLNGDNGGNPLVRRMTIAHELGHFLWDPDDRLRRVVVDAYANINRDAVRDTGHLEPEERRANAFAIEFLAPRDAIRKEYERSGGGAAGLSAVIQSYGVSKVAAARHLYNASHGMIDVIHERTDPPELDEWNGREMLAVPLFVPQTVPVSRRGRFAGYVLQALEAGQISRDTAASLFGCDIADLEAALRSTRNYVLDAN